MTSSTLRTVLTLSAAMMLFGTSPASSQDAPTREASPVPAPAPAPARVNMADFLVNRPHISNWQTWGLPNGPATINAAGVTGGKALRAVVTTSGDPWSVGAVMATHADIKAGDVILLGVWLRSAGEAPASLKTVRVEQKDAPNTAIAQSNDVPIGPAWTLIYASGIADRDYTPDQTTIVMHLGDQPHTIDIGPALMFDLGPDYDVSRLPRNAAGQGSGG